MSKVYEQIDDNLERFIQAQSVFFVATAPLDPDGHVNCSPKGLRGTLSIIGPDEVAYLDLTGSGVETIAHVQENGRIVLMFCAFEGRPKIVRLHGVARVVFPGDPDFSGLMERFEVYPGIRGIISVKIERVSDSCGWAVPDMRYVQDRSLMRRWAESKGEPRIRRMQQVENAKSVDGLRGMPYTGLVDGDYLGPEDDLDNLMEAEERR